MNIGGIVAAISGSVISMFGSTKNKGVVAREPESPEFRSGYKAGHEAGLIEGMNLRLSRSKEVSRKEYDDLIRYLTSRGLIISYSQSFDQDRFSCGLIIRKDNTFLLPYQLDFQPCPKIE